MIALIIADNLDVRRSHIKNILDTLPGCEVLIYDDTYGGVQELEQYAYPSLFNTAPAVVHSKFLLAGEEMASTLIKTLVASPTLFVFEELALPATVVTSLKKLGAVVHQASKEKKTAATDDIFVVTKALTATDKKSRWLIYRAALETHAIEAIMGVLYWKVRELTLKDKKYAALYRALITAHATAWQKGIPLELAIEKVLLTHI